MANLLVAGAVLRWKSTPRWRLVFGPLAWVGVPILGSVWYDVNITNCDLGKRGIEVVVVQPNIDPYNGKFAFDPRVQLQGMLAQAESRMTDSTRLVVLPETALQEDYGAHMENGRVVLDGLWENDINASRSVWTIERWLQKHPQVRLLAGMSAGRFYAAGEPAPITSRPFGPNGEHYDAYNAAVLVDTSGAIYELARKHCGDDQAFKIGLAKLHKKVGTTAPIRKLRAQIRAIEGTNHLPDYAVSMDADMVTFTNRNWKPPVSERQSGFPFLKPETFTKAKAAAPGWDVYRLEQEWREWSAKKEPPKRPDAAFVAFCRKRFQTQGRP